MSIPRKGTPDWKIHPGEILREEFLKPLGMSVYKLAKRLHVPTPRVNDIVLEKRGITADSALDLAAELGTSPELWLNLQMLFDLNRAEARRKKAS